MNYKKAVLSFINAHADEQVSFTQDLCNQNSYTHNKKGVDRVAEMILDQMNSLMPVHNIFKQDAVGDHILFKNRPSSRAIYLVGHMDTVFPPDHPFQKCRIEDDRLYGPGTGDMKGGLAVIVYALKALKEAGRLDHLDVAFLLNSDEEIGSITSRPILLKEIKHAATCLAAECGGMKGEIVVSRNGKLGARIDCFGRDRHVSAGSHEKDSAILELACKIIAVESLNACFPGVSLNVGKIEGGLSTCTVPSRASCLLDVRWTQEEHKALLLDKIHQKLSVPSQPGCRSEFTVLNERPSMPLRKATEELFSSLVLTASELGMNIGREHRRGTSDANFFGSAGVPTLDGFGPISEGDHTPDECIRISSLKERTALLALFLAESGSRKIPKRP